MQPNVNPRVIDLLSWHGQAGGGVHVPFQTRNNPLGEVIETPLVRRLRALAAAIASDASVAPRRIFLVGGPGNGKSETVEDFLRHLDTGLNLNGALTKVLTARFSPSGLIPRKVEVTAADFTDPPEQFATRVGRLIVVQDATATDTPLGNAAKELAQDVVDLLTGSETPIFIACVNRGLLARAMKEAFTEFGAGNPATRLFANIIRATGIGGDTLERQHPCWPLEEDNSFATWPMDIESLLEAPADASPLAQALLHAIDAQEWNITGRCLDCSARDICPFLQNAVWLSGSPTRANLLTILRRGELARGQRWNFRDAFSLIAELIVGQWSDFGDAKHPCEWVHQVGSKAQASPTDFESVFSIVERLYPHALFKAPGLSDLARAFLETRNVDRNRYPYTVVALEALSESEPEGSVKPIREALTSNYALLDPGKFTPAEASHPLRSIEDAFCQSVEQGLSATQQVLITSHAEKMLLEHFQSGENEWDLLSRDSAVALRAVCLLRKVAAVIAKRSVGVRLGKHALERPLAEYQASLRDMPRLTAVRNALRPLLGSPNFQFNLVETIGQPTGEGIPLISLQGQLPGITPVLAPTPTDSAPGHDVPCIQVGGVNYRIPVTFDFFLALQLRKEGCTGSSLPATVRAALDRLRHRYAGSLCRNDEYFADGRASVRLAQTIKLALPAMGSPPSLVQD